MLTDKEKYHLLTAWKLILEELNGKLQSLIPKDSKELEEFKNSQKALGNLLQNFSKENSIVCENLFKKIKQELLPALIRAAHQNNPANTFQIYEFFEKLRIKFKSD